jgi:hypothetical protein
VVPRTSSRGHAGWVVLLADPRGGRSTAHWRPPQRRRRTTRALATAAGDIPSPGGTGYDRGRVLLMHHCAQWTRCFIAVDVTNGSPYHRRVRRMTAVTLWRSWMSSSSATHDTVSRQPPWRGVASPHVLLMPTVLLALAVLFQAVDTRLATAHPPAHMADTPHALGEQGAGD